MRAVAEPWWPSFSSTRIEVAMRLRRAVREVLVGGHQEQRQAVEAGLPGRRRPAFSVRAMTKWYLPWPEVMKIFWPVTNHTPSRPARPCA
jgi:hypothetical protein